MRGRMLRPEVQRPQVRLRLVVGKIAGLKAGVSGMREQLEAMDCSGSLSG